MNLVLENGADTALGGVLVAGRGVKFGSRKKRKCAIGNCVPPDEANSPRERV